MTDKIKKIGFLASIGIIVILTIVLLAVGSVQKSPTNALLNSKNITLLENNWSVVASNEPSKTKLIGFNNGSKKIDIEKDVTYTFSYANPTAAVDEVLIFENNNYGVKVYIKGILSYENERAEKSLMSTALKKWNIVDLNQASNMGDVHVVLTSQVNMKDVNISPFYIAAKNNALSYVSQKALFPFAIAMAILAIGIVAITLFISSFKKHSEGRALLYMGIGLILYSAATFSSSTIPQLYLHNLEIWYFLYAIFISIVPIFLAISFIKEYKSQLDNKVKVEKVFKYLLYVIYLIAFVSFFGQGILQLIGIDYVFTKIANYIVYLIVFALPFIVSLYLYLRNKNAFNFYRLAVKCLALELVFVALILNIYSLDYLSELFNQIAILVYSIGSVGQIIYQLVNDAVAKTKVDKELKYYKANALAFQIKPDFLIDALDDIKAICLVTPKKASQSLDSYSMYLRSNLKALSRKHFIKFSQEFEHIHSYLDIVQIKYGNKVKVTYDDKDNNFWVPPVSVELFVENAVRKGIIRQVTGGEVIVKTWSDIDNYYFEVQVEGSLREEDFVDSKDFIGIDEARSRLVKEIGAKIVIKAPQDGGTCVIMSFPKSTNAALKTEQIKLS